MKVLGEIEVLGWMEVMGEGQVGWVGGGTTTSELIDPLYYPKTFQTYVARYIQIMALVDILCVSGFFAYIYYLI